jgi:tol-pal system protein YbgF
MRLISNKLAAYGLVILTGLCCLIVQAQDYVDVEAERAAEATRTAPVDPYGARPAPAYPATSFGINNAPAGTAVAPASTAAPAAPPSGGQVSSQNLANLFSQLQQLQQEVMRLNGRVEEQANELRKLKEQSLERYVDIDKRLSTIGTGAASGVTAPRAGASADRPAVSPPAPVAGSQGSAGAEQPGEAEAYRAAYALVQAQKFDQAIAAFRQFQLDYPAGKYAPNAYYWLGELYLVVEPADLESSRQSFMMLLTQYPGNSKVPDALYKLGKVQFLKGNPEKAREYLDRVIAEYGSTNSSAVKLSRDFIAENY